MINIIKPSNKEFYFHFTPIAISTYRFAKQKSNLGPAECI